MHKFFIILFSILFLKSCSGCGGKSERKYSHVSIHKAFVSRDSSNFKIELNVNDTISYSEFFITWDPSLYFFSDSKNQWNILNELIPTAYACYPPTPIPLDSIQNINIRSSNKWNSTIKADSSLNSIFKTSTRNKRNTLLSLNEYKNEPIDGILNFYTSIPPDSIRNHIFVIDFSLKNGKQFIDTLKSICVVPF